MKTKMYLLTWTTPMDGPIHRLYRTFEDAKRGLNENIGEFIRDCVKNGNLDTAKAFLDQFTDVDERGMYGTEDELWIEKLEVE